MSVTLCLRFLGVTTKLKASSCSGGLRGRPPREGLGDDDTWPSVSLSSKLLLVGGVGVAEDMPEAAWRRPGAGRREGGSGNDDAEVVMGGVAPLVRGLYMDTGLVPVPLGAALSLT